MTARRCISVWISLFIMAGLFTQTSPRTSAASEANPAAFSPWKLKTVDGNTYAHRVNVAHGGASQYPLLSITDGDPFGGYVHTDFWFPAIGMTGSCGSQNDWLCLPITDPRTTTKASRMAVHQFTSSFMVSWVVDEYLSHWLTLNTYGLTNNLVLTTLTPLVEQVVDLNYIQRETTGTATLLEHSLPALAFDEAGYPHIAFLLHSSVGRDTLWYAYRKTDGAPTRPCNANLGTPYQCDFIVYEATNLRLSSPVSITISATGKPYISFILLDNPDGYLSLPSNSLILAYPAELAALHPNCGPGLGIKSWRCTVMETSGGDHLFIHSGVPPQVEMAIGPGKPHLVYKTSTNGQSQPHLRYAEYVGAGGNCGEEYNYLGNLAYRWSCSDILAETENTVSYYDFSLKVDTLDYPVVAYTNITTYIHPYLMFPSARAGGSSSSWKKIKLDGTAIDSGYGLDLALNKAGLGLVGFVELEEFEPNLKLAYQDRFLTFLPSIRR